MPPGLTEAPTREGKEPSVLAQEEADKWRNGLADWGFGAKDLSDLSNVSYTLFTPDQLPEILSTFFFFQSARKPPAADQ